MKSSIKNIDQILNDMAADHPGDIIADILHWCDEYDEDFDDILWRGKNYYLEECAAMREDEQESLRRDEKNGLYPEVHDVAN